MPPVITEETRQQRLLVEAQKSQTVKRWLPVLKKCPEMGQKKWGVFSQLLENQYNAMTPKSRMLFEETTTTNNIADFTRFALPLLRKSYARLIADNLVGVQPMSQPASLLFYIRYRYAMNKGQTRAGTQIMRQNTSQQFARQNGWALDPYYSAQTVKGEPAAIGLLGTTITATLQHRPVLAGTVIVNVYQADVDSCEDPSPCLQVAFDSTGHADTVLYGSASGCPTVTVDTTQTGATYFDHNTGIVTVTLSSGNVLGLDARVDYEFDLENNPFQPALTLSIDSDSVSAVTRKLKTINICFLKVINC